MTRRFEKNEATFNELISQLRSRPDIDYLGRNVVYYEDGRRADGPEAESNFRALMKRLNLDTIWARGGSEANIYLELVRKNYIWVSPDGYKGYTYMFTPPHPDRTAKDLDALNHVGYGSLTHYKHLKGNWYLYIEFRDS